MPSFAKNHEGMAPNETVRSLDWWMDERRGELRLKWSDVARRAGVTTQALRDIRKGGAMRTTTRIALEQALHWQRGSIDAILRGGEPVELPSGEPEPVLYTDEERELWSLHSIPAEERRKLIEHLRLLRQQHAGQNRHTG